jgi:hypothetical protein
MKTFSQLKELTKDYSDGHWRKLVSNFNKGASSDVIEAIKEHFSDVSIQEAVYRLKNNIEAAPKCLNCDSPAAFRTNPFVEYRRYCSTKCQHEHSKPSEEHVVIDGCNYDSITAALKSTGLTRREIMQRIFDSSDVNASWKTNHERKCIEKLIKTHAILANKFELAKESGSNRDISEKYGIDRDQIAFAKLFHQI